MKELGERYRNSTLNSFLPGPAVKFPIARCWATLPSKPSRVRT